MKWLTGSEEAFSMEERIFHYVCLLSTLVIFINLPINHFIGLPFILTVILITICLLILTAYYISRWKNNYDLGVVMFGLICNLLFCVNFFFSGGTYGATLLYFLLSFFLTIISAPRQQYPFWIILNIILVGCLISIELYNPDLVQYQFSDRISRYVDLGLAYMFVLTLLVALMLKSRKYYYREKKAVEIKALELAKINEEKNKLFSVIAHDLRAPVASIQNYLEILESVPFTEDEKKKIEHDLLNNTLKVNEMIENLLTWVKSQLNGVKPDLKTLFVLKELSPMLELSQLTAKKKNISLDIEIAPDTTVFADTEMLQLIIRNLISNAIKFTSTEGFIKVKAFNRNHKCIFEVTDNGIGIADQEQENIFSHKIKSKTGTMNEKGSALGLIICRDYVMMQNGQISLESKEGKGTTFFVVLPAQQYEEVKN